MEFCFWYLIAFRDGNQACERKDIMHKVKNSNTGDTRLSLSCQVHAIKTLGLIPV